MRSLIEFMKWVDTFYWQHQVEQDQLGCLKNTQKFYEPMPKEEKCYMVDVTTIVSHHQFIGKKWRSEEHTSELQSRGQLVCRLLLEKKKHKRSKNRARNQTDQ